jgi:hypothetical protein
VRNRLWRALLALIALVSMTLPLPAIGIAQEAPSSEDPVTFPERTAVPQWPCRPSDRPETDLQGRVPREDLISGRAAQGYTCNLDLVGRFRSTMWANLDTFEDCAYYGLQTQAGGVQVLDVSDSTNPTPTALLTTTAMQDPGESLRVNAKRKLLVATGYTNRYKESENTAADYRNAPWLDVYDLSEDCRAPRLVSSTNLFPAMGHEGWFSPDGMTYFMSSCCLESEPTVFPVDLTDPSKPRVLGSWDFERETHGGFTTEDNRRSYVCQQVDPPYDALHVAESKGGRAQLGRQPTVLSTLYLGDNRFCQGVYRVTYDGKPYLIQYGEASGQTDCNKVKEGWANYSYPRFIDISDERMPRVVGWALLEVDLPQHCTEVDGEGSPLFGYSTHHCSPDRLYDPTILACANFHSGLRVFDIRNPRSPVEIAYYNPGLNLLLGTIPRPVIRADRREIWFGNDATGFNVVRFADGVWPFADAERCPSAPDYYFRHYNPSSTCSTASFSGLGKRARGTN